MTSDGEIPNKIVDFAPVSFFQICECFEKLRRLCVRKVEGRPESRKGNLAIDEDHCVHSVIYGDNLGTQGLENVEESFLYGLCGGFLERTFCGSGTLTRENTDNRIGIASRIGIVPFARVSLRMFNMA